MSDNIRSILEKVMHFIRPVRRANAGICMTTPLRHAAVLFFYVHVVSPSYTDLTGWLLPVHKHCVVFCP